MDQSYQSNLTNTWADASDAVAARVNPTYEGNSSSSSYNNNSSSNSSYNNGSSSYTTGNAYGIGNNSSNNGVVPYGSTNKSNVAYTGSGSSSAGGYATHSAPSAFVPFEDVKDHNAEMKNVFGHNGFREGQKECVEAALSGRDVFCLMPTGGGKSVVYQLPAWCTPGLAVIFSPLISLIQDQVDALTAIGIRSVFMSSTQDEGEVRQVFQDLFRYDSDYRHSEDSSGEMEKRIKMLYITPERFAKSEGLKKALNKLYSQNMISRFVIDEAHCLSQWGHDFRPDYLGLREIRNLYPKTPIMCLTATANQTVVGDSISIMGMRDSYKHTMSFNRANLHYSVLKKEAGDKLIKSIAATIRNRQGLTGIIYCLSKNDTETVANSLKAEIPAMKSQITFYHADVAADEKEKRQRSWSKGTIKVICATIAFGMGINKPDVRYVIHHSVPKSLTNYYQESGRAGRDGGVAECIMFFSYKDKGKLASMIQRSRDEKNSRSKGNWKANQDNAKLGFDNLHKCVSFCLNDIDCRRVLLLEYFGEKFPREKCLNTCDNCKRVSRGEVKNTDMTAHALFIVCVLQEVLGASGRAGGITLSKMSKVLSGSRDKETVKFEGLLDKVRAMCVQNYSTSAGKSYHSASNHNGTALPPPPTATVNKDVSERVLQHMVLQGYVSETSVENASGFNADYLEAGELDRITALQQGQEKLIISMRQKGKSNETFEEEISAAKKIGKESSKNNDTSHYLDLPGSGVNAKTGKRHTSQDSRDDDGWLTSGTDNKLKRSASSAGNGHPSKDRAGAGGGAGAGMRPDSPPELDSYRSQYSPEEETVSKPRTFKPLAGTGNGTSTGSGTGAFKVPLKGSSSSSSAGAAAAGVAYGEKRTLQQQVTDARTKARASGIVSMVTGSGKAVSLNNGSKKIGKPDRWNNIDSDGEGDDGRPGQDVNVSTAKRGGHASSSARPKGNRKSDNSNRMFGTCSESSSDDSDRVSRGGKTVKRGRKRSRNTSDIEDADEEIGWQERRHGSDEGKKDKKGKSVESPCLLSHKKQAAFLAWIDTFRRQWDGYWNKLPEVRLENCSPLYLLIAMM